MPASWRAGRLPPSISTAARSVRSTCAGAVGSATRSASGAGCGAAAGQGCGRMSASRRSTGPPGEWGRGSAMLPVTQSPPRRDHADAARSADGGAEAPSGLFTTAAAGRPGTGSEEGTRIRCRGVLRDPGGVVREFRNSAACLWITCGTGDDARLPPGGAFAGTPARVVLAARTLLAGRAVLRGVPSCPLEAHHGRGAGDVERLDPA